jgi:hypothetical protein
VTAMVALVASYVVVDATAADEDADEDADADEDGAVARPASHADPSLSPWALSVIQAVLPLAACAPVALALQTLL